MNEAYQEQYLSYYLKHDISPVSQDVGDLDRHFHRRAAMYRHCGLPPSFIRGKKVLEFGPGSGHNALFTGSLEPSEYVLVDGNPKGIEEAGRLLGAFSWSENCRFLHSRIQDYSCDDRFDLVICEGVIPTQLNPSEILRKVASFVSRGGVLLVTCSDYASSLSEDLRKVLASLLLQQDCTSRDKTDARKKLDVLRPFFTKHLANLEGMSRPVDDWIYDNVMQPTLGIRFSIKDAVETLSDSFDVYGSSPHFFTDWRWYKEIHGNHRNYNQLMIDAFLCNVHNLMDYRSVFAPLPSPSAGETLYGACRGAWEQSEKAHRSLKAEHLEALCNTLSLISNQCAPFSGAIPQAISEFTAAVRNFTATGRLQDNFSHFPSWFGRGQQYLSFIKK